MFDENPQVLEADLSWNILTMYFLNQLFTMSIRILQEYNIFVAKVGKVWAILIQPHPHSPEEAN